MDEDIDVSSILDDFQPGPEITPVAPIPQAIDTNTKHEKSVRARSEKACRALKAAESVYVPGLTTESVPVTPNKRGRPVKWTEERLLALAEDLENWMKIPENCSIGLYLAEKGLYDDLVNEYTDKFSSFSRSIQRIKVIQGQKIASKARTGEYNAKFCQFELACKHGWRLPPQEVQQTTDMTVRGAALIVNFTEVKS